MNHVEAYATVYANALQAYIGAFPDKASKECTMPKARESARRCVEDFRDLIKGYPECAEQRPAPDLEPENPESGAF